MDCICIEIIETGERRRIDLPIWITVNRNGILATPHRCLELEGYPEARIIPLAEYLATLGQEDQDPELTPEEALNIILGGNV